METGNHWGVLTKDAGLAIRDNDKQTSYFFIKVKVTHKITGKDMTALPSPVIREVQMDVTGEYWAKNKATLEAMGFDGANADSWKHPQFNEKLYTDGLPLYCKTKVSEKNGNTYENWYISLGDGGGGYTHTPAPDKVVEHWVKEWTGTAGGNGGTKPTVQKPTSSHTHDEKWQQIWDDAVKNLGSVDALKAKLKTLGRIGKADTTTDDLWNIIEESSIPEQKFEDGTDPDDILF